MSTVTIEQVHLRKARPKRRRRAVADLTVDSRAEVMSLCGKWVPKRLAVRAYREPHLPCVACLAAS